MGRKFCELCHFWKIINYYFVRSEKQMEDQVGSEDGKKDSTVLMEVLSDGQGHDPIYDTIRKCDDVLRDFETESGDGKKLLDEAMTLIKGYPDLNMKSQLILPWQLRTRGPVTAAVKREQSMRSKRRLRQSHLALQSQHKRTRFFEVYRRKFKKRLYNERADKANDLAIVLDNLRSRKSAEMDRPGAPPPVPTSGYNIWMGQMKFKLMHLRGKQESDDDRPSSPSQMYEDDLMPNFINDQENKASAADMGKLWRSEVSEQEKRYYSVICVEIRKDIALQFQQYAATGKYEKSKRFDHFSFESDGSKKGVWMRKQGAGNGLERWLRDHFKSEGFLRAQKEREKKAAAAITSNASQKMCL